MTDPIDLNHPDVVRLTEILQQLTAMFSAGGFQSEIRDPYTEYGSEIPGRDMKITHVDVPAYYAVVKASAPSGETRLVAQSATFNRPGLTGHGWSPQSDVSSVYGQIVQFITQKFNDFRRDESSHRRS
jgi:hypothetical protein